jgi:hypothetical protein
MKPMRGVLFFSDDEPQITGYLVIGNQHFEIAGWHASDIRADLSIKRTSKPEQQADMFDDRSCEAGERKRDLA